MARGKQHLCPEVRGPLESRGKGEVLCHCCGAGQDLTPRGHRGDQGSDPGSGREPAGGGGGGGEGWRRPQAYVKETSIAISVLLFIVYLWHEWVLRFRG